MKIIKRILFVLIATVIFACSVILIQGYSMYKEAIKEISVIDKVEQERLKEDYITLDKLPVMYKNAVISVEDHRFYQHGAVDFIAIGRAILTNIKAMKLVEGGSTITQQLAKNLYFTQEKEITRKVAELFVAIDLEKNYNKDEILELYVNTSYFGDGYYGIKPACKGYFKKEPMEMTPGECTMVAGIPNAPSVYAPTKSLTLAKKRQERVLQSMVSNGYLSQEEVNGILEEKGL